MIASLRVPAMLLTAALLSAALPTEEDPERVDFARDVRPILSSHCLACHGPDEGARAADLRLDVPASAFADRGGFAAIVPGNHQASEAWLRVVDDVDPMPPTGEGDRLTREELDILRRWIEEGAEWAEHWAFAPPTPSTPPTDSPWARGGLDGFVLSQMQVGGLEPSPAATPETLIRRLSLDLTGLPPTPAEVDAFLADSSDAGYERAVDRLLASPRFGERFALPWLDAARYADTNGYHRDAGRTMWLWRDWLIDALNANKPYDEFVIEQLAGDLLPDATIEQQVASGFNRNHMLNDEGGAIAAEYQAEYVIDRVRTTSTVFLGLTMACGQCHDHKYDPITQEEYYRFYAFFNKLPEKGLDGSNGPAEPKLVVPTPESEAEIAALGLEMDEVRDLMAAPLPEVDAREAAWARETQSQQAQRWTALQPQTATSTGGAILTAQPDHSLLASGPNPDSATYEVTFRSDAPSISALRLELVRDPSLAKGGVARTTHANLVVSEVEVEASSAVDPGLTQTITLSTAVADYSQKKYPVVYAIDGKTNTGWAVDGHVLTENRNAIFLPEEPFGFEGGTLLRVRFHQEFGSKHTMGRFRVSASSEPAFAADAEIAAWSPWRSLGPIAGDADELFRVGAGIEGDIDLDAVHTFGDKDLAWELREDLVDGEVHTFKGGNSAFYYYRTIDSPTGRTASLSFGSDDSIVVWLNGERIVNNNAKRGPALDQELVEAALRAGRNELLVKVVNYGGPGGFAFRVRAIGPEVLPAPVTTALASAERSEEQSARLRDFFRRTHVDDWSTWTGRIADLEARVANIRATQPALMVMRDQMGMRKTRILERGQYDHPGREVTADVPAFLPPISARDGGEPDRLDLARWMVDPAHPLTARVAVNRLWYGIFGRGLVETIEDFGTQGALPSHPGLLDHLAGSFVESGWDVKGLVREIVSSSTYRQSSRITPDTLERDPRNTLLARAPKFRLQAELVRDNALAISGLLHEERGGPSVKPYQPAGLWKEVSFNNPGKGLTDFYQPDSGAGLYRRSMYTFWKRSLPPPSMQTFDAPTREVCVVKRDSTNTPLQALITLNDPTYVEAARALGQLVLMSEVASDDSTRLALAFRRATSREPDAHELRILTEYLNEQRAAYAADTAAAAELLGVGESMPDESLATEELAAWTLVMSLILNLDETLTRS